MMVVGIAMLGSLTVLPALLSKLGDQVEKGKIPFLHRLRRDERREPVLEGDPDAGAAPPGDRRRDRAAAVLVAMALPVLHLHTAQSGLDALPNSAPTVPTIKKIQSAFSNGTAARTEVAIKADIDAPATQQAIAALKRRSSPPGSTPARSTSRSTRRTPSRASTSRSSARARTPSRYAALRHAPQRDPAGDDRQGRRRRVRRHRRDRRPRPTRTRC